MVENMYILIDDIPEEGMDFLANEDDSWIDTLMKDALNDDYVGGVNLSLHILRWEDNVTLDGDVAFFSHNTCDKCLSEFENRQTVHIHMVFLPSSKRNHTHDDADFQVETEDVGVGFYDGDRINISDMVKEFVLLYEPVQCICSPYCKGLCPKCGKNLNEGACACKIDSSRPTLSALKNVVLKNHY